MYTTLEKILLRVPEKDVIELTDDAGEEEVDQAVLDQAIADAQAEVDGKLRGRYPVPLPDPVPLQIERITTVLVIHNIYSRRHQLTMSDGLARQYKVALKDLEELQDGRQVLEGFENSTSHPSFMATNKRPCDRVFSKGLLGQMP